MTDTLEYTPPEVWVWEKDDSPKWRYGSLNRPIAGATHEKELPRGKYPLQLYFTRGRLMASRSQLCWRSCWPPVMAERKYDALADPDR